MSERFGRWRRWLVRPKPRLRRLCDGACHALAPVALALGVLYFGRVVNSHVPLREWLFWRYAGYWLGATLFCLACLGAGARVLSLCGRIREGVREQLVVSFGLGVLCFFLGMFGLGVLGLLRPAAFVLVPLGLLALGGMPLVRLLRDALRLVRRSGVRLRPVRVRDRVLGLVALVFGIGALVLIYGTIIPPENALFDAQWYHLGIAEHYVAQHAVRPFAEGWFPGAYPHLASYLYSWAFLLPVGRLYDRVSLCAHIELAIFLWTLGGVSVLVRRLVPKAHVRHAWVVVLLFPGLYLYDSSLGMGADHVAALWAPLIFIGFLRAWRDFSARSWLLAAAPVAGAALTKYTAASLVVFPVLGLCAATLWRLGRPLWCERRLRFDGWRGPVVGLATGLALTAPHWLKNWLWYGNPVYPFASTLFANRPWSPEAEHTYRALAEVVWAPQGTFGAKLKETVLALWSFSFEPNDWPKFHGKVPVFGSLFTLSMLALPFLRGTRRVWALAAAAHAGLFFWYWTQHEDRYLQALVPWMAAVTAAVLALAWQANVFARVGVAAMVGLQVVWGGDVPFVPAHAMMRAPPLEATIDLLGGALTTKGKRKNWLDVFHTGVELGKSLPPGSRLLLHEQNPRIGIGVPVVSDAAGFQGGLAYGGMRGPAELYATLRRMKVTHVAWRRGQSRSWDSLAGDLVFHDFALRYTAKPQSKGGWTVAPLVDRPAEPELGDEVLYLGCDSSYRMGVYRLRDLAVPSLGKHKRADYPAPSVPLASADAAKDWVARVRYVVHEPRCVKELPAGVESRFSKVATRKGVDLWAPALANSQASAPETAKVVPGRPGSESADDAQAAHPGGEPSDPLDLE
jgi:hypothetical protein